MRFEVIAIAADATPARLTLDASDAQHAQREANSRGYHVIAVRAAASRLRWLHRSNTRFPLTAFAQELCALLAAGIGLVEALHTLAEKEDRPAVRSVLRDVIRIVSAGAPLSAALRDNPAAFPALFVATVRAAEKTGDLPEALARFVAYRTQLDELRKKVVGALIYPVLLLAVGSLVTLFLLAYVVPRFASVYEDAGRDLPFLSQWLLVWGRFFEANWAAVLGIGVALVTVGAYAGTRLAVVARLSDALWRIPSVGERLRVYQLARLYRTLGMLLQSGLPVVAALGQCSEMLPPQLRPRLLRAVDALSTGQPISAAMHEHGLTTPVALRMLRVGERSGRMSELMGRIAAFHEEEMARAVEWFTRLFEPMLMLAIGAVIGLIVVLMYVPVFELAGSLQ
jgi:general secretion pathway protein F